VIHPDEALRLLAGAVSPGERVEVSLDACYRLVLAETIVADRDFPPTDRSAMDGFAVRAEDAGGEGAVLSVVGEVAAGRSPDGVFVGPREAVRIYTGAVVPPGADSVVMVEDTETDATGGAVKIGRRVRPGQHVRLRASDLREGETILEPGMPIHAAEMAALTSVGATRIHIHRPPTVGVLSTGDEIIEPDATPEPHQVRNSNAGTLLAQLREVGLWGVYLGNAGDSERDLADRLEQGLDGNVLLISGGVSVGDYDLVGKALERAGVELLFHKVAMKPGKPILAGRRGDCLVMGLPGNPVSVLTGFAVFAAPALRKMMGYRRWHNREVRATLDRPLACRPGRMTYHLARITWVDGRYAGHRVSTTGSGDVLSMARANGFIVTPEQGGEFGPGDELPALLWSDSDYR
jgi:molybdopterin molybdotransferase